MPFVPALNVAEVKLSHTLSGVPDKGWVLHYKNVLEQPWDIATLNDLASRIINWWDVHMQPLMNSQARLDRVRVRDITTQFGLQTESTAGLPLNGTRAGTMVSPQVVLSIKKNTGFTGKTFRGRVYQFAFNTGDLANPSSVNATYINLAEAAWNEALLLVGALDTYNMVLVSKFFEGQPRAAAQVALVQSMNVVDSRVDTNRLKLARGSA